MIAACVLQPGEYFAINTKGAPTEVVAKITAAGFPVMEEGMQKLATGLGETTMFGRAGRRADFCRRHGAHVLARFVEPERAGALVSLRHHVRGTFHFDDP